MEIITKSYLESYDADGSIWFEDTFILLLFLAE
jgi:hypothetical protein